MTNSLPGETSLRNIQIVSLNGKLGCRIALLIWGHSFWTKPEDGNSRRKELCFSRGNPG